MKTVLDIHNSYESQARKQFHHIKMYSKTLGDILPNSNHKCQIEVFSENAHIDVQDRSNSAIIEITSYKKSLNYIGCPEPNRGRNNNLLNPLIDIEGWSKFINIINVIVRKVIEKSGVIIFSSKYMAIQEFVTIREYK